MKVPGRSQGPSGPLGPKGPCEEFRLRWLEARGAISSYRERDHPGSCRGCEAWARSAERSVAALKGLARGTAPAELERRLESSLSLAPTLRRGVEAMRSLSRVGVPAVLDRLVDEELAAGERATAERFAGDLPRSRAPRSLEVRIREELTRRLRPTSLLRTAAALAAAVLVWLGARAFLEEPERPAGPGARPFEVVRLERPSLDPMTRSLDPAVLVSEEALGGEAAALSERTPAPGGAGEDSASAEEAPGPLPAAVEEVLGGGDGRPHGSSAGSDAGGGDLPGSAEALVEHLQGVPGRTRHAGVRRVHLVSRIGGEPRELVYRELLVTDGGGRFALRPFDVVSRVAGGAERALLALERRSGFLFRYRDFLVRDAELLARNYALELLPGRVTVAGRSARLLRVESRLADGHTYEVAVDEATGLVLEATERDAERRLVARVVYERFADAPELAAVTFHERYGSERELDPRADLEAELGAAVLAPVQIPAGYEERSLALVEEPHGRRWLKRTYLDGVNALFFLHALQEPGILHEPDLERRTGDHVLSGALGTGRFARGSIRGFELIAAGKVGEEALLDLIESALP